MGLVSTIIPVFNRPGMILEAIDSVKAQSYQPIEIIVVDDGSTDETPLVLEKIRSTNLGVIHVIKQQNCGPGVARNRGLQNASGDFIQFLDSDDLLEPKKFELQVQSLIDNPNAGVSCCITNRLDPVTGQMLPWAKTSGPIFDIFPSFLPRRGWATLTPLWRRAACEQIGPWADFRVMEDWEHDLRAGMLGIKPVHVPEVLCTVRDHDQNRASGMNTGFTTDLTRDFFRAHESVWLHMKEHGLTNWAYVGQFSRTMFWVARMCGSFGLVSEAERALDYTDEMTHMNGKAKSTRAFRLFKGGIGWKHAVNASEKAHTIAKYVKGLPPR